MNLEQVLERNASVDNTNWPVECEVEEARKVFVIRTVAGMQTGHGNRQRGRTVWSFKFPFRRTIPANEVRPPWVANTISPDSLAKPRETRSHFLLSSGLSAWGKAHQAVFIWGHRNDEHWGSWAYPDLSAAEGFPLPRLFCSSDLSILSPQSWWRNEH